MSESCVTVVLPCLNEAESLPGVLAAMPTGYSALVVDNNSTDGTAAVARRHGARVVAEFQPGYGAAVHAGVVAADTGVVAVLDGDGSMDPRDLVGLVAEVDRGADMAVGRRRPRPGVRWPWHARLGTVAVCWRLRHRHGLPVHDIAPMRVARRDAILDLGVEDRRSGYPLELLVRAAAAGWTVVEHDVGYGTRTGGKSKVSGSVRGSYHAAVDFLAGDLMTLDVTVLVVAKAPVPGLAKTRLAAALGFEAAADVAAAALLDTLDAVAAAPVAARVVAMTGDLGAASRSAELRNRLADFTIVEQRGADFAERLVHAHADASAATGLPVLQIGMDTPQVSAELLTECATTLLGTDAVLGMADDGGWWVLGVHAPTMVACLSDVPMSTSETGAATLRALRDTDLRVELVTRLSDVDTVADVEGVRRECAANSRFRQLTVTPEV